MRLPNAPSTDTPRRSGRTSTRREASDRQLLDDPSSHELERRLAGYQHQRHQLERQHDLWSRRLDLADLTVKIGAIEDDLAAPQENDATTADDARHAERLRLDAEIRDCQLVLALAKAQHRPADSILEHAATIRRLEAQRQDVARLTARWRRLDDERRERREALDRAWQALGLPRDRRQDQMAAWRAPLATNTRRSLATARERCGDLVQLCRGLTQERSNRFRRITETSELDWWTVARATAAFGLLTVGGLLGFLGSMATGWLTSLFAASLMVAMALGIRWRQPRGEHAAQAVDQLAEIDAALRGCADGRSQLPMLVRMRRVRDDLDRLLDQLDLPAPPTGAGWSHRLGDWHELLSALVDREQYRHRTRALEADLASHEKAAGDLARALGLTPPKRGELGPWIERLGERLDRARAADTASAGHQVVRRTKTRLGQLEARRDLLERPASVEAPSSDAASHEHRRLLQLRVDALRRLAEEGAATLGLHDWRRAADLWDKPVVRTKRTRLSRRLESTRREIARLRRSRALASRSAEPRSDYRTRPVRLL